MWNSHETFNNRNEKDAHAVDIEEILKQLDNTEQNGYISVDSPGLL